MKSPKAPAAPDPVATAQAQGAVNKETAIANAYLNNVNQYTPYGSLEYKEIGKTSDGTPQFSSTIKLSPEQQQLLNIQNQSDLSLAQLGQQQIGRIQQSVSSPYSYDGLPSVFGEGDQATAQTKAEEAIMSRLNPQFARDEEALRTRLINQGITQGSKAYDVEMERFNQTKNDARMQSVLSGQQYASAMLGDSLQRRNQGIQEYNAVRNAPLNEYTAFTNGQQIQNPNFQSTGYQGAQPADYAGAAQNAYQAAMNNYNTQVGARNSNLSTAGQFLGTAATLFSDETLKENIKPVGVENGHKVYEFNYKGDDKKYIGVMAQEVEKINPEAVINTALGYKAVNYDMIGVTFREAA